MDHPASAPCCAPHNTRETDTAAHPPAVTETPVITRNRRSTRGQVHIPAGSFAMGDAFDEGYPADGEQPVHTVHLPGYYIDATAVSNAQFATFVKATGYTTDAERYGTSAVFRRAVAAPRADVLGHAAGAPWWLTVAGASWRHPEGAHSTIADRQNHPVVHVSHHDALAYCAWAGKCLPTEAEWEHAARGGMHGKRFAWGDDLTPNRRWRCNIWQGDFPTDNTADDGHLTTASVKTYPPNGHGLYNTAGNVWEWCADWFSPTYYTHSPSQAPAGPDHGQTRVMRGGSYLCHHTYCHRYRVAARSHNTPDSSSANLGFRCANNLT